MSVLVDQDRDEHAAHPHHDHRQVPGVSGQQESCDPEEGMNPDRDAQEAESQVVGGFGDDAKHRPPQRAFDPVKQGGRSHLILGRFLPCRKPGEGGLSEG